MELSTQWHSENQCFSRCSVKLVREEVQSQTYRAFELCSLQEKTPQQAANELGMSVDAVYAAKHRILKRIQKAVRILDGDAS